MTTLLLIRHGESEANRADIFAGQINPDLEQKGLFQAEKTAKFIAENYAVDVVYASDLQRAFKTGKALSELIGVEIIPNKNLREIDGGLWENESFYDLPKKYPEDFEVWMNDLGNACPTGGESVRKVGDRVFAEITKIAKENDGKTVAVATHATVIRAIHSIIKTGSVDKMKDIPYVSNASVTEVAFDGEWKLVKVGMDEHLGDMKTELPTNV